MTCAATILGAYRRAMDRHGEAVIVEAAPVPNIAGDPASGPSRARIAEFTAIEIAGGITAGTRKAIVNHEDLASTPYPGGLVKGARIVWAGRRLVVDAVDNGTRRVGGMPIAYQCRLSGA